MYPNPDYGTPEPATVIDCPAVPTIQGQILRLTRRREVAIYLRYGRLWIADFIDGCGELIDPATWIRFNCGSRAGPHARRRMAVECAVPLYEQLEKRIEELHRLRLAVSADAEIGRPMDETEIK